MTSKYHGSWQSLTEGKFWESRNLSSESRESISAVNASISAWEDRSAPASSESVNGLKLASVMSSPSKKSVVEGKVIDRELRGRPLSYSQWEAPLPPASEGLRSVREGALGGAAAAAEARVGDRGLGSRS